MPKEGTGPLEPDTSYLCVVDSEGNAFSSTPGDGARETPFVPGFGFIISSVLGSIFTHTSRTRSSILTGRRPSLPRCCARTSTSARGRARPRRADAADAAAREALQAHFGAARLKLDPRPTSRQTSRRC
jgi:hypothetical protein